MRTAVVGHVEWVEFARVERVPSSGRDRPGERVVGRSGRGRRRRLGAARAAGRRCTLFTALGRDDLGGAALAQLDGPGRARRGRPPRRAAAAGLHIRGSSRASGRSRSSARSTCLAEAIRCRGRSSRETDAVYFVSGDADAARAARRARVLVATARSLPVLAEAGGRAGRARPQPPTTRASAMSAATSTRAEARRRDRRAAKAGAGARRTAAPGSYRPAPLPGPIVDAYGAGDSFAAGLTYALGRGDDARGRARLRRGVGGRRAHPPRRARSR